MARRTSREGSRDPIPAPPSSRTRLRRAKPLEPRGRTTTSGLSETSRAPASPLVVDRVHRLAASCTAVAAGFEACTRHAKGSGLVETAERLALEHRALAEDITRLATNLGTPLRRTAATCERLRWEWLASTGASLDGVPDDRLLAECMRLLRFACEAADVLERDLSASGPTEAASRADRIRSALHRVRRAATALVASKRVRGGYALAT